MASSTAFSSANSTLTIYDNKESGQHTAMAALQTALNAAVQTAITDPIAATAAKQAAFNEFIGAGALSAVTFSLTGSIGTLAASPDDGAVKGTWKQTDSGATGTWYSTATTTANVTSAKMTLTSGIPTTASGSGNATFTFTITSGSSTLGPVTPTSSVVTFTAGANIGTIVGKITAMGDTGVTASTISAKLLNEAGTFKGKGSSDQGELSVDFLRVPTDDGQKLMFAAQEDMSQNANRVFCINHNNGGIKWYCVGMVSSIKTTRGAIDSIVNAKATILIQDGAVEVTY